VNICLIWWSGDVSGETTRFNKECFEEAGHKVILTNPNLADVVFTPVTNLNFEDINKPVIVQFGGYGRQLVLPDQGFSSNARDCFEKADLVTILDPSMFLEMDKNGVDGETVTIPNATPPITIPPRNHAKFRVLCPATDSLGGLKNLDRFVKAAEIVGGEEDIEFVIPVKSKGIYRDPVDWLEVDNLKIIPHQPYNKMLEWYGKSDVIAPFSAHEIHPQTFFEGCLAGKPVIMDSMGLIQSVHWEHLGDMIEDFGMNSRGFHRKWRGEYGSGEGTHYLKAESSEELAELVLDLYANEKKRVELGNNAFDWVSDYWESRDRGERIIEVFKNEAS